MYPWFRTMYAVVQIGSTILRSECMTTRSTVSDAAAGPAKSASTRDVTTTRTRPELIGPLLGSSVRTGTFMSGGSTSTGRGHDSRSPRVETRFTGANGAHASHSPPGRGSPGDQPLESAFGFPAGSRDAFTERSV